MNNLYPLLWLTALVLVAWYWHRALETRDRALVAAKQHCQAMDVQMLDQSVYLRRLWFRRNARGHLSLWRAFYFEFTTTGADRYIGRVILLGARVEAVQLDPHRIH